MQKRFRGRVETAAKKIVASGKFIEAESKLSDEVDESIINMHISNVRDELDTIINVFVDSKKSDEERAEEERLRELQEKAQTTLDDIPQDHDEFDTEDGDKAVDPEFEDEDEDDGIPPYEEEEID